MIIIIIMREQKSQSKNSRNVLFSREIKGYRRILSSLTMNKKKKYLDFVVCSISKK